MKRMKIMHAALAVGLAVMAASAQAQTQAATPAVAPEAIAALNRMGAYLRTLTSYQVQAATTTEDVLDDGQKILTEDHVDLLVQIPNHLRLEQDNDRVERLYLYDGKTLTMLALRENYYASVPAPPTFLQLIDALEDRYGIDVPLVDLFLWGTPRSSAADMTGAMDVGPSVVAGTTCEQYAFRRDDIDFQIWIQKGDHPLPRKIVITSKTDEARPQFRATYTWNLAPSFDAAAFILDPPPGALRIAIAESQSLRK